MRLVHQLAEEWYRQLVAWRYERAGYVVLFDRHFYADRLAHDIRGTGARGLSSRLHGVVLDRLYPRPDLVILLDAPARVLFERKGEGTVELIESRRQEYFQLREVAPHFAVVDAERPLEEVEAEVISIIRGFRDRTLKASGR